MNSTKGIPTSNPPTPPYTPLLPHAFPPPTHRSLPGPSWLILPPFRGVGWGGGGVSISQEGGGRGGRVRGKYQPRRGGGWVGQTPGQTKEIVTWGLWGKSVRRSPNWFVSAAFTYGLVSQKCNISTKTWLGFKNNIFQQRDSITGNTLKRQCWI